MNPNTIPPRRTLRVQIGPDHSRFLIFGLLTWSQLSSYFPAEIADWPAARYWIVGALTALLVFASGVPHEQGHALATAA